MITLITGCMGSGKTARLIELAEQVPAGNRLVLSCYNKTLTSRNGKSIPADAVLGMGKYPLMGYAQNKTHIFIDEGQWLTNDHILNIDISNRYTSNTSIFIALLNRDYTGRHYNTFKALEKIADEIEYLHAVCAVTRGYATYSELLTDNESTRKEDYRAVCWDVFKKSKHCKICTQ